MPIPKVVYGGKPETIIYKKLNSNSKANKILLGTILDVVADSGDFYSVTTRGRGKGGFVKKEDILLKPILKMFFVDVAQGDGILIESEKGIIIIDAGPNANMYHFLLYRYRNILSNRKVTIDQIIISHPDHDHFAGLIPLINDTRFKIGSIYHNGIQRFGKIQGTDKSIESSARQLEKRGALRKISSRKKVLTNTLDDINSIKDFLNTQSEVQKSFRNLWEGCIDAHSNGRLNEIKRINVNNKFLKGFEQTNDIVIEILGPIPNDHQNSSSEFLCFNSPKKRHDTVKRSAFSHSHTRNGHSIVLKLIYGQYSVLLGGDLNIPAQKHLMNHYKNQPDKFEVDVCKACHHGSADYDLNFIKKLKPQVTVVSSGDHTGGYDHPMPDAIGAYCRHGTGDNPLLFSTEIGRATSVTGKIHYGLVNLRSDGKQLVMAQMKEIKTSADIWHSFTVPWDGEYIY